MIDFANVQAQFTGHPLVRSVDRLPKGHVRLETGFLYPDGASVDVFLVEEAPLLPSSKLSDLGQTMSWLLDVQVKPWLSKKRQRFVEDALRVYGVTQSGGALELPLEPGKLVDGVVRLGQACVRVADLIYTRRTSLQAGVVEEVEEVLADSELDYQPGAELDGRFGARVRVDFLVRGHRTSSTLLTLSSYNSSAAHGAANEIFRKWYDLDIPARSEQRVTILDDRSDVYRSEDVQRLKNISDVVPLSDRQSLVDLLAA